MTGQLSSPMAASPSSGREGSLEKVMQTQKPITLTGTQVKIPRSKPSSSNAHAHRGAVLPQQGGKRAQNGYAARAGRHRRRRERLGWGFGHRIFTATRPRSTPLSVRVRRARSDRNQRIGRGAAARPRGRGPQRARDVRVVPIDSRCGISLASLRAAALSPLGGSPRKELPAYASLLRYGDPAAVTQYVERALKRGYRYLKLHEITVPPVKAAREAAGRDVPIMVDCNCPWTVGEAIAMAHKLEPFNLKWLEEPVWPPEDHAGLALVQARGGIATAAGENAMLPEFKSLLEHGAITYAQPSVTKVGGVTQMRKVMAL